MATDDRGVFTLRIKVVRSYGHQPENEVQSIQVLVGRARERKALLHRAQHGLERAGRARVVPPNEGALEAMLAGLKKTLGLSSASYKDLARLNLVLGLMTLRLNKRDSESEYAALIRAKGFKTVTR